MLCNCVCVCLCMCLFLYILRTEYQNIRTTGKMRTFLGAEDILAGLCKFKGLFEGSDWVLRLGLEMVFGQDSDQEVSWDG